MLQTLLELSTVSAADADYWWPAATGATPAQANNVIFTPEEPTTLALALIAIVIIGAFVGIQRLLRPRRSLTNTVTKATPARTSVDRPSRGAA